jgi:DNA polymerase
MSYRFNICDINAVETRVGAWLADCKPLMDVFVPRIGPDGKLRRNGNDPYLEFGSAMNGVPYETLWYDLKIGKDKERKGAAKRLRQIAKPGVLGAIYRLGPGGWGYSKDSFYEDPVTGEKVYDKVKTGLFGYADNMGVELTQDQSKQIVQMFRKIYKEIPEFWYHLENMSQEVLDPKVKNVTRNVGPEGCVEMNRINIDGRDPLFRMRLPSGRHLHYFDAFVKPTKMPWTDPAGNDVFRPAMWYSGQNQKTHQWTSNQTHGGILFNSLVQGISRDILALKLLMFEEADLPVHAHVHDEGICLVADDPFSPGVDKMEEIMAQPVDWAPGLLLGADGFEDSFYHK